MPKETVYCDIIHGKPFHILRERKLDRLNTLIEELRGVEGDYPDTLLDDIVAARDEDMSVLQAKIDTLEAGNAEATTQITSLKNELYDLGKQVTATPSDDTENDDTETEDDEGVEIDDFFETVEEK